MSVSFSPESLQETKRSLQRKAQREKTLAEFIEPAAINAESEVTRALLVAETDARILGLQRESALCLLPNLVSAFRRETLLHLLEQRKCPRELLQDMIASLEVRAGWRKSVAQYSAERIKSRFCNRNGPIRQQGTQLRILKYGFYIIALLRIHIDRDDGRLVNLLTSVRMIFFVIVMLRV